MSKYKDSDSSSTVQQEIEDIIFERFKDKYNLPNAEPRKTLKLSTETNIKIKPDIYCEEPSVIGEIHSHIGKLKAGQMHKVTSDILKMILFERENGEHKKYYVVCDSDEEEQLNGDSYVAAAMRSFGIDVVRIDLTPKETQKLREAMEMQNMLREE